jgi:hypothetical protein
MIKGIKGKIFGLIKIVIKTDSNFIFKKAKNSDPIWIHT